MNDPLSPPSSPDYCQYQAPMLTLNGFRRVVRPHDGHPRSLVITQECSIARGLRCPPHLPPPICRCQQEVAGDQQIERLGAKTDGKAF